MSATSTTALEIRDLSVVTRSGVKLVDGVSFAVPDGTICGIVGETGAGKTMTIRAVLGLLAPGLAAEGVVHVGGDERNALALDSAAARTEQMGVVLQNPAAMLDPVMPIGSQLIEEVVLRGAISKAAARERALRLLASMGFPDPDAVLRLYPHQLSGGMAQRTAIAMALMAEPQVLIVDEPTSALDANLRVEVLTLLQRAAREQGISVVLVSHDLGLVSRFCEHVVVMYSGRIVERGPTAETLAAPAHPYTRGLLEASPSLDRRTRERLRIIPGVAPRADERPDGCWFAPRCPLAFDRCRAEQPELREEGARGAACHLAFED